MAEELVKMDDAKLEKHQMETWTRRAVLLKDFIKQQGLSRNFGGQKDHIFYEAWAFLGELGGFYTSTEKIDDILDTSGNFFGVRATVVLIRDSEIITRVTASCTKDEPNWRSKPRFQLESMAQTRAASKAFRMRLSPVVALAGYSPTPAEEMDDDHPIKNTSGPPKVVLDPFFEMVDAEHMDDRRKQIFDEYIQMKMKQRNEDFETLKQSAMKIKRKFWDGFNEFEADYDIPQTFPSVADKTQEELT